MIFGDVEYGIFTVEKHHYRQHRFLLLVLKSKVIDRKKISIVYWQLFIGNPKYERNLFLLLNKVHKRSTANNPRCLRFRDHDGTGLFGYILVHLLQINNRNISHIVMVTKGLTVKYF